MENRLDLATKLLGQDSVLFIAIDDQNPCPCCKAVPLAIDIAEDFRIALGGGRMIYLQQSLLFEPQCVEDLVVPKHIAPRPVRLGDDGGSQPDRLGALQVVLRQHANLALPREQIQNWLGEFAIQRRVDDYFVGGFERAAGKQKQGYNQRRRNESHRNVWENQAVTLLRMLSSRHRIETIPEETST